MRRLLPLALASTFAVACQPPAARQPRRDAVVLPLRSVPQAIAGTSDDDVWILDAADVRRWNGAGLLSMKLDGFDPITLSSAGPTDVWIGGSTDQAVSGAPNLRHWNGKKIESVDPGGPVLRLYASGKSDVWAAGLDNLAHFDGSAWSAATSPTPMNLAEAFFPVAGSGATDVWAYHSASELLSGKPAKVDLYHFDGSSWSVVDPPSTAKPEPQSLWAAGPNELWLVGDGATVWRRLDGAWSALDTGHGGRVRACAGRSPTEAFAIVDHDDGSDLLRWDGKAFTVVDSVDLVLEHLWVGPRSVWVTGAGADKQEQAVRYPL